MSFFGAISDFFSGGNQSKAGEASQRSIEAMEGLETPEIARMQLQLEELVSQGVLSPEQAKLYLQDSSAMNGISTDPMLQQAQYSALDSLQDLSASGGMTDADRANLSRIQTDENTAQRGAREAILQNAAARGMSGSGMELMAQLQNQQDSATRQSQRDMDVTAQAQARALQALQSAGALGGQMQAQSFGQKAQVAAANDAINQFNTQNTQSVSNLNTAARNTAMAQNLAEKQRIADANVGTQNAQQQYNKQLAQQDFENQYKKAGGTAGAYQNQAAQFNATGDRVSKTANDAIEGVGRVGAWAVSDKNLKENVEEFDASLFLDSLTPSKYNYKDSKFGKGKQVGVMAQEIEREVPQMVEDTPEGKIVNYDKAGGPIFASLADIHQRLKRIEGK